MELCRVDFPGYVRNPDRAIEMLGGTHKIFNAFTENGAPLTVNFRPNDQLSHPIQATASEDPCILIRIRVKKIYRRENGQRVLVDSQLIPEFIGKCRQIASFDQPSDFQFLPPLSSHYNQPTVKNPPPVNFLYLPPVKFIHNYKYDNSYIQRKIFATQHEQMKTWIKDECPWIVDQKALLTLDHGPPPTDLTDEANQGLLDLFNCIFARRPIWTAIAILDQYSKDPRIADLKINERSTIFFRSLACVAYFIKSGPFQMTWVRYGVNPIRDSSLGIYQTAVLSLKTWEHAEEISRRIGKKSRYMSKIEEIPSGLSTLTTIPNRLYYALQLCDLHDSYPSSLTKRTLDRYNFTSGWFPSEVTTEIRKFCLLKISRMLKDERTNPEIIMADITTAGELKTGISAAAPQRTTKVECDYEFFNEAQAILGMFDGPEDGSDVLWEGASKVSYINVGATLHMY